MNWIQSHRIRVGVALVSLGALSLLGAACGDDDDDDTTAIATSTATAAATTATQATTATATTPAATATPATATSTAGASAVQVGTTTKGAALLDANKLTLYTFDNDTTAGKSSCNGGCAATWPPVVTTAATAPSGVTGASGTFTLITRDDGTKQVAYNGKPLYRYAPDTAAGDVKGDGVGGVWHLATP